MGDNGIIEAVGKGFRLVETRMKGYARNIRMHDVFHMSNLLSVSKLISRGLKVHFNLLECVVRANNGDMLAIALLESNLYQLHTNVVNETEMSIFEFGHKRLGHLNVNNVKMLQSIVGRMDMGRTQGDMHSFTWKGCVEGK